MDCNGTHTLLEELDNEKKSNNSTKNYSKQNCPYAATDNRIRSRESKVESSVIGVCGCCER